MKHNRIFAAALGMSMLMAPLAFAQSTQNGCAEVNPDSGTTVPTPATCGSGSASSSPGTSATSGNTQVMPGGLNAPNPDMGKTGPGSTATGSANAPVGATGSTP